MTFVDRKYPDVVRDVLTNLTQGISGESHTVNYDPKAKPVNVPDVVLQHRPVRRVSHVRGLISAVKESDPPVPYDFTLNDYELVPNQDRQDMSRLRFLPFGKKPAPGTDITVNYYPRTVDPAVINDLNVGSVVRTILEAVSKEISLLYAQLNLAYDSAFLETAMGTSLDNVVALLGYQRFRAGRPVGSVIFGRRAGLVGDVTIPAGTPVTDSTDKIRYETVETHEMLAGESVAEVRVRGSSDTTPPVDAGVLTVIQRAVAGLDTVTNEKPTSRASNDETDDELRARARAALLGTSKGTVQAITNGLLQLPEVRDVKLVEMPNGIPGEIKLFISLANPPAVPGQLPPAVEDAVEELRPAGVRVLRDVADSVNLQVSVKLVLAGSFLPASTIDDVHRAVRDKLVAVVKKQGVGQTIRVRPLVAALLADNRVVDAVLTLGAKGAPAGSPGSDFSPPAASAVDLLPDDISFQPDQFDKAGAAAPNIAVQVNAVLGATAVAGLAADQVKTQITARLKQFFGSVVAGTSINAATLLTALRDDTRYAIDPLKLRVTLTAQDQFVQISQGGQSFTVLPQQTFSIGSVEVSG